MEETDTFREIVFFVWGGVVDHVDLHAARCEPRAVCPVRRDRCRYLRGYTNNHFCLETAGSRSPALLGSLRYRLFRGDICHPREHGSELDSAAVHDGCVAGCGFPSRAIPSAPTDTLEALDLMSRGWHISRR
jgi:hypothetical protein